MELPFSDVLGPVLSVISDVYNSLMSSPEESIRFISLSAGLALYVYFVWHFYHKISARDMAGFISKGDEKSRWAGIRTFFSRFFYVIKYLMLFPLYAFAWFAFLAIAMALLNPGQDFNNIFMISALIISTTRILAYVKEDAAQEISKLLPLVFISSVLLNQTLLEQPIELERMVTEYMLPLSVRYFLVIIPLEIMLRIGYDVKRLILPNGGIKEEKGKA